MTAKARLPGRAALVWRPIPRGLAGPGARRKTLAVRRTTAGRPGAVRPVQAGGKRGAQRRCRTTPQPRRQPPRPRCSRRDGRMARAGLPTGRPAGSQPHIQRTRQAGALPSTRGIPLLAGTASPAGVAGPPCLRLALSTRRTHRAAGPEPEAAIRARAPAGALLLARTPRSTTRYADQTIAGPSTPRGTPPRATPAGHQDATTRRQLATSAATRLAGPVTATSRTTRARRLVADAVAATVPASRTHAGLTAARSLAGRTISAGKAGRRTAAGGVGRGRMRTRTTAQRSHPPPRCTTTGQAGATGRAAAGRPRIPTAERGDERGPVPPSHLLRRGRARPRGHLRNGQDSSPREQSCPSRRGQPGRGHQRGPGLSCSGLGRTNSLSARRGCGTGLGQDWLGCRNPAVACWQRFSRPGSGDADAAWGLAGVRGSGRCRADCRGAGRAGRVEPEHPHRAGPRRNSGERDRSTGPGSRGRADGTTLVTSGREVAESVFEIDDEPSEKGFYKNTDRIVKDNGKPDCAGNITKVGTEVTNYIRFHPSFNMMIICKDES